MKLTDLDRVIELVEKSVDMTEALTLLRKMRENAVEGMVDNKAVEQFGITCRSFGTGLTPERHPEMSPALLITPEDE